MAKEKQESTYTLFKKMCEGVWSLVCTFNANNWEVAKSKSIKWAYYHGMSRDEVYLRPAVTVEIKNKELLHNEWVN